MSLFLTLDQVAEELQVPRATVRYWVSINRLPAYKPGRHLLIKVADMHALIDGAKVETVRATRAKRTRAVLKGAA